MSLVVKIHLCINGFKPKDKDAIDTSSGGDFVLTESMKWYKDSNVLDVSDYVLDDEISIEERVEGNDVFEFESGGLSLTIMNTTRNENFINSTTYLFDDSYGFALEIILDGTNIFWGSIDKNTIAFDRIDNTITFDAVNWYKTLYDSLANYSLPDIIPTNVEDILEAIFVKEDFIDSVNISVGDISQTITSGFYTTTLQPNYMPINDFILELQKFYGAFLYVDQDRVLQFVNRGQYNSSTATAIDDYIEDINYEESQDVYPEYNSIVINLIGDVEEVSLDEYPWVDYETAEGWFHCWLGIASDGSNLLRTFDLNGNIDRAETWHPYYKNYLDLRQKVYYSDEEFQVGITYPDLFPELVTEEIFELYSTLFGGYKIVKLTLYGLGWKLFDKVTLDSSNYSIFSMVKNIKSGNTEVELIKPLTSSIVSTQTTT